MMLDKVPHKRRRHGRRKRRNTPTHRVSSKRGVTHGPGTALQRAVSEGLDFAPLAVGGAFPKNCLRQRCTVLVIAHGGALQAMADREVRITDGIIA
ncbi:MAG: hypothetical protein RL385_1098 [Pseudomonadota bacterium]